MTPNHASTEPPRTALFRVEFRGGFTFITKAANSLKAEQIARRRHPGLVARVRILKGSRP